MKNIGFNNFNSNSLIYGSFGGAKIQLYMRKEELDEINKKLAEFSDHKIQDHLKAIYEESDFNFEISKIDAVKSWEYTQSRYVLHPEPNMQEVNPNGRRFYVMTFITRMTMFNRPLDTNECMNGKVSLSFDGVQISTTPVLEIKIGGLCKGGLDCSQGFIRKCPKGHYCYYQ